MLLIVGRGGIKSSGFNSVSLLVSLRMLVLLAAHS